MLLQTKQGGWNAWMIAKLQLNIFGTDRLFIFIKCQVYAN